MIKGLIGTETGTLIKYKEVVKKLKIPREYFISNARLDVGIFEFALSKYQKIVFNEVVKEDKKDQKIFRVRSQDFKQTFGIEPDNVDIRFVLKKGNFAKRIPFHWECVQHYLDRYPNSVYLWLSKEGYFEENETFAEIK